MSDYSESSRRRDRHRRHRGRDGKPAEAGQQRPAAPARDGAGRDAPIRDGGRRDPRARDDNRARDERKEREKRVEPLPPLPKLPTPVCAKCGEPIQDITSALCDKESGSPVHFDCVLQFLQGAENLAENEKIVYIGQGRFAVMVFENPADTRKFTIVRTIEWERREDRAEWRTDISGRFSQIK